MRLVACCRRLYLKKCQNTGCEVERDDVSAAASIKDTMKVCPAVKCFITKLTILIDTLSFRFTCHHIEMFSAVRHFSTESIKIIVP